MAKGIIPHNRLVGLNHDSGHAADKARDLVDFFRVDSGCRTVEILVGIQRHYNLFHRGVSCALTDSVNGALNLPGPACDRSERVRNCKTQVIVAVDAYYRPIYIWHMLDNPLNKQSKLIRYGKAHRIRDINRSRPG